MREVKALVARAAGMRVGVLICGEPGTGRRMVARNIHAGHAGHAAHASPTAAFVTVDCAAADPEQVERALFGQVGRLLSDDAERRSLERVTPDSRLVAASGGTLYLRDVVEMSARLQSRLVRVLRDREVILAGVGQPLDLDIRPIAAVDPSAERAVKEGRLREDLLRRLSAVRIDVPPLRGRREDIPALANHFLREMCADRGVPVKTLTRPALSLISALPWSGNAVELRALLEQVVLVAATHAIAIDDVLAHVRLDGADLSRANGTLRQARERFEREYIASVLDHHRGRMTEAARALGIQRPNLYRKMRSLKVSRERRQ